MADTEHEKNHLAGDDATAKVRKLLGYYRSAMLTTVLGTTVHTRPMGFNPKGEDFNGSLWCFTDERSRKVQEINAGAAVSLIYQSDEADSYLHLHGTAVIDKDRTRMKDFYNPLLRTLVPRRARRPEPHAHSLRRRPRRLLDLDGGHAPGARGVHEVGRHRPARRGRRDGRRQALLVGLTLPLQAVAA